MIKDVIIAAKLGGEQLRKHYGKSLQLFEKTHASDFRTKADLASEKEILNHLKAKFPDYNYYAEESGWVKNNSEYTFVIDPLDGTNNYSLGISYFSISIALKKKAKTIIAVIYDPIADQLYHAELGAGSFLNNQKLQANNVSELSKSTISYACGYDDDGITFEELIKEANHLNVKRLITMWSPALDYCRLASGKIESVICKGNDVYDNLAGKLLVKEAGGVISKYDGSEEDDEASTFFVASSNINIHKEVLSVSGRVGGLN